MMNKAADKNQSTAMEAEAEEEVVEAAEADVIAVSTTEVKMTKVVSKKTKQRERRKANFGAPMALADAPSNVARKGEAVGEDPVAKLAKKTAGDKSLAVQEESLQQE